MALRFGFPLAAERPLYSELIDTKRNRRRSRHRRLEELLPPLGPPSCSLSDGHATIAEPAFPSYASSAATPLPSRLPRLILLTPPPATLRPTPRVRAAALGHATSPLREVGPALPGRRAEPAPAASLSFSARPSPPPAPHRARGGVALLVVDHGGPAAAATGLPPVSSHVPTPLAKVESARLSPPPGQLTPGLTRGPPVSAFRFAG